MLQCRSITNINATTTSDSGNHRRQTTNGTEYEQRRVGEEDRRIDAGVGAKAARYDPMSAASSAAVPALRAVSAVFAAVVSMASSVAISFDRLVSQRLTLPINVHLDLLRR